MLYNAESRLSSLLLDAVYSKQKHKYQRHLQLLTRHPTPLNIQQVNFTVSETKMYNTLPLASTIIAYSKSHNHYCRVHQVQPLLTKWMSEIVSYKIQLYCLQSLLMGLFKPTEWT